MCRINSQLGCGPQQCGPQQYEPQGEQYSAGGGGAAGCTLGAGYLQWGPGHPGYSSVEAEKEKKDTAKTWQDTPVKKLALPEMVKTFLIKSNIKKVEDIEKKSDEDLLDVKGVGEKALKLIKKAVRKLK